MKAVILSFFILLFLLPVYGQNDTLPTPTMKSNKLVTLLDFYPEAVYGNTYTNMMYNLEESSSKKTIFNRQGSKFILPAIFIAYGTAARFNQLPIRQFDFDIDHEIRKHVNTHYSIDNYLEMANPVLAFGLDFIPGIDAAHNLRDRTLIMLTSYIVMEGMVKGLKYAVPVTRPRGWGDDSFPSGHMAVAMTGAHIMFKEYSGTTPWIGIGGYMIATATGAFRMMNYAHWFSDVVMSAGIGLLSAEIGYMMLPVWHSIFGIQDGGKNFVAAPTFSTNSVGLGLVYRF